MKMKDNLTKILLFLIAVNVWGVAAQFIATPKPVVAQTPPSQQTASVKQYAWGMRKSTDYSILALSPDVRDGQSYSYRVDLADVADLTAIAAKKGWRVHTIGLTNNNNGYFVLFEK